MPTFRSLLTPTTTSPPVLPMETQGCSETRYSFDGPSGSVKSTSSSCIKDESEVGETRSRGTSLKLGSQLLAAVLQLKDDHGYQLASPFLEPLRLSPGSLFAGQIAFSVGLKDLQDNLTEGRSSTDSSLFGVKNSIIEVLDNARRYTTRGTSIHRAAESLQKHCESMFLALRLVGDLEESHNITQQLDAKRRVSSPIAEPRPLSVAAKRNKTSHVSSYHSSVTSSSVSDGYALSVLEILELEIDHETTVTSAPDDDVFALNATILRLNAEMTELEALSKQVQVKLDSTLNEVETLKENLGYETQNNLALRQESRELRPQLDRAKRLIKSYRPELQKAALIDSIDGETSDIILSDQLQSVFSLEDQLESSVILVEASTLKNPPASYPQVKTLEDTILTLQVELYKMRKLKEYETKQKNELSMEITSLEMQLQNILPNDGFAELQKQVDKMLPSYEALYWTLEELEELRATGEEELIRKAKLQLREMELLRRRLVMLRS